MSHGIMTITPGDTIATVLDAGRRLLVATSDSPRLDAEVLLAHVLNRPRSHLYAWPEQTLDVDQQQCFDGLLKARAVGEPVAYLIGEREFWSLSLRVTPDTLIPRPETETLVSWALEIIPIDAGWHIADLGTGNGAIALAIAHERPTTSIIATDISAAALAVSKDNGLRLGLENIRFLAGDWCEALHDTDYDMIVSNPPYIPLDDPHLDMGDVRFEPSLALTPGTDGLTALARIAASARNHLQSGGFLLLEHGYDQGEAVAALLQTLGYQHIDARADVTGQLRVTAAVWNGNNPAIT